MIVVFLIILLLLIVFLFFNSHRENFAIEPITKVTKTQINNLISSINSEINSINKKINANQSAAQNIYASYGTNIANLQKQTSLFNEQLKLKETKKDVDKKIEEANQKMHDDIVSSFNEKLTTNYKTDIENEEKYSKKHSHNYVGSKGLEKKLNELKAENTSVINEITSGINTQFSNKIESLQNTSSSYRKLTDAMIGAFSKQLSDLKTNLSENYDKSSVGVEHRKLTQSLIDSFSKQLSQFNEELSNAKKHRNAIELMIKTSSSNTESSNNDTQIKEDLDKLFKQKSAIDERIKALEDLGLKEYMIKNDGNRELIFSLIGSNTEGLKSLQGLSETYMTKEEHNAVDENNISSAHKHMNKHFDKFYAKKQHSHCGGGLIGKEGVCNRLDKIESLNLDEYSKISDNYISNDEYNKFKAEYTKFKNDLSTNIRFTDEGVKCKGLNDYAYQHCSENLKKLFPIKN